jgi:hypothetical protein
LEWWEWEWKWWDESLLQMTFWVGRRTEERREKRKIKREKKNNNNDVSDLNYFLLFLNDHVSNFRLPCQQFLMELTPGIKLITA